MRGTNEENNRMLVLLIISVIIFTLLGLYFSKCEERIEKLKKAQIESEKCSVVNNTFKGDGFR